MNESTYFYSLQKVIEYKNHFINFWCNKFIFFNDGNIFFFMVMCFRNDMFRFTFDNDCFITFITVPNLSFVHYSFLLKNRYSLKWSNHSIKI